MNRREDPLLRQHRSRLLQLAEATNIKPGRGSSKRRGQRQTQGFTPSNGGASTGRSLQDIVRSDPGYTPNIEHLVFPERKSSNPNLTGKSDGSPPPGTTKSKTNAPTSGRSRLVEVFAKHYSRGSLQDTTITSRKNHLNSTSLDSSNLAHYQQQQQQHGVGSTTGSTAIITSIARNTGLTGLRWLSQTSQSSRQHSTEEGTRGGSSSNVGVVGGPVSGSSSGQAPALPPRRVSPATDTGDIGNTVTRVERGPNLSIVHLCNTSDPWEVGSQGSAYSVSSNKSQISTRGKSSSTTTTSTTTGGSNRGSYTRGSSIPSLKRHDTTSSTSSLKQHRQDSHGQVSSNSRRREAATSAFLSGSTGTSGELFIGGNCSRELSPVRWCDREVDGVYLGRSGWVQVQQRSLDENRRINYESSLSSTAAGNLSLPRRAAIKLADYHCSNSEPGKCPQDFSSRLDSQRPDYLALHGQDYESCGNSACTSPRSIPESFSPPSITPIISPPPAFQDVVAKRSSSRHLASRSNYGKAPFLPRSNAIDTDLISPPPSPPQTNWSSLPSSSRKSANAPSRRRQNATTLASNTQQQQQQQHYRMAQAKSLEDQSSSRRYQFVQRYLESSSSSSSSMGFRSLDSCVTRSAMPRLAENTDSSVEGYEDGDEDDNPSSSLNLSLVSSPVAALNSSTESIRANGERISPSNRLTRHHARTQQGLRRSPGSSESGKQLSFNSPTSSSSSSSSVERHKRSPTPNHFHRRGNVSRQHQSARTSQASPDSLQSRVRRSRSLQLPEKRSPSTAPQPVREHSRESNESSHRLMIKLPSERGNERSNKRYTLQNRKVQSTDDALNEELFREAEAVTEYLYGTRSRVITRNFVTSRYERHEERRDDNQEQRRANQATYDVYFISSKQQQQSQKKEYTLFA
ncbi:serine-rich adhesin for platelets-like [Polistes fuscatus]|uniref:serine-rich adhesin for platelets-like n=1 Tax=Polistes fuscatus TaxID=30207 RepID=UPI001CA9B408|nr:serine-rich adhesin for platelets-like [Polistes fuscatus]